MPTVSVEKRNELDNIISREVLCFLARHPFTKFNRMALIGNFDTHEHRHVDRVLKKLVAQELVAFQSAGNLFWLTPEEPAHSLLCSRFGPRANVSPIQRGTFSLENQSEVVLI
jgi:hypothetical protein